MTTKKKTQGGSKGKGEVNHLIIAWALAGVIHAGANWRFTRAIVDAANRLGAAIGAAETYDLRPDAMLRNLLDAHAACAYDLDGQDKGKGRRAYAKLIALAGGPEGSHEPEDKASCAWACWTMRRIRGGFYANPGEVEGSEQEAEAFRRYGGAWREVETLLFPLWNDQPGDKSVSDALAILGTLVMRKQSDAMLKGGAR